MYTYLEIIYTCRKRYIVRHDMYMSVCVVLSLLCYLALLVICDFSRYSCSCPICPVYVHFLQLLHITGLQFCTLLSSQNVHIIISCFSILRDGNSGQN